MSMFIVSNDCLNDVSNLIVKLYPKMDLNVVFKKLLDLNINIFNNKYNANENIDDYLKEWKIIDYSNYVYKDNCGVTKFKSEYWNVQITQLVESFCCYNYQISEPIKYIDGFDNITTYEFVKSIYNNPLINEIIDYINYNGLNEYIEGHNCTVKGVDYR